MSTHDYVIDNQSAPAFRADLNNVLAAIASQNSSGTAPTVTFANMIWYDTTANQIKKRNEANSAWIVLGTIDETAGTFTPSGERALATQVQAEAGTDNTTLMTPLRSAQAIAALTPTTDVMGTIAATYTGNIGTLAYMACYSDVAAGATIAGTSIRYAGVAEYWGVQLSGIYATGTWRAMGYSNYFAAGGGDPARAGSTLFLRIA